jgi:hypothetical protein
VCSNYQLDKPLSKLIGIARPPMDEYGTNRPFHSIFRKTPTRIVVEIMPRALRLLRATTIFASFVALCSATPKVLAWKGDELAPWVGTTFSGKPCVGERITFGPFDYLQRASRPNELEVVEDYHFTPEVEKLEHGATGAVIADLHYTLGAWPNHHRALNSVLKYRLQHMGNWGDPNIPPAECYMQRAIKFSPNDPKPYMMYGLLLHKAGKYEDALKAYETATRMVPDDIMTQYNMGLALVELKKYEEARQVAVKVYAAGFPLPGLKNKLMEAGHWKGASGAAEPEVAAQAKAPTVETPGASTAPSSEENTTAEKVAP